MAENKWIEGLRPDTQLSVAGQQVLRLRLNVVGLVLPLAVQEADGDLEHVHRLRVATRRADAALSIFRSTLSEKAFHDAHRRLRRLRRAAGMARDWDVFLLHLSSERPKSA